jgi:hypothetical protein
MHKMTTTQISAYISESTKEQVEAYVKRRGVKKGFLIEEALLHHLQVLKEIPEDVVIPARLVLTDNSMEQVAKLLESDQEPSKALQELLND